MVADVPPGQFLDCSVPVPACAEVADGQTTFAMAAPVCLSDQRESMYATPL